MNTGRKGENNANYGGVFLAFIPILILLLTSVQSGLATDPLIVDNGDYTFTASWEFEDMTNYTQSNLTAQNSEVNLTLNNYYWNQSNEADFATGQRSNVVSGEGIATSSDDLMLGYLQNQNFTSSYYWNFTNSPGSNVMASWSPSEEGLLYSSYPQNITPQLQVMQPDDVTGIDTYLNENSASTNYGSDTNLRVERGTRDRRTILWFDLSTLSDAKIIDATLELYMYTSEDASSLDISAHRITNSWAEMDATWDDRNAFDPWTSAGGDFDPAAFDTLFGLTNNFGWKIWNITTLVDGWGNGTYQNFGVLLNAPSGSNTWKEFYSSDYTTASFRPILRVTYYPLNTFNESAYISQDFTLTESGAYRDASIADFQMGIFHNSTTVPGGGGQVILGSKGYFKFEPMENVSYWSVDTSTSKNDGSYQLSNTVLYEGTGSMRVDYDLALSKKVYGVLRNALTSWDWSRYTDLEVWARSSGYGEVLKVILEDTWGTSWTSNPTPLSDEWVNYTFDLGSFPGDIASLDRIRLHFTDTDLLITTYIDNITLIGGAPYFPEGNFTSRVHDGGYPVQWETIIWEEGTPAGTSLEIFTRTGNTSTPDPSWSAWSSSYGNPSGSTITSPMGRYIQYMVNLDTTIAANTPYISEVILVKIEYNMTFKYSVAAFDNVTWANLFLELNGDILWEKGITGTSSTDTISIDIGRYLYTLGHNEIRVGLRVNANSTNDVNITTTMDDFQIQGSIGFFVSQIYDAGSETIWGEVVWNTEFPPTTNLSLNVRTSLDNSSWSPWSPFLAYPSDNFTSSIGRYIQYRVNFTTETLWLTPVFKDINITYFKYAPLGTLTFTTDILAENVTSWGVLSVNCTPRGQNIGYEYSIDSGSNWNPVAGDLNLSTVSTASNKIRFKVIMETGNTSLTPTLLSMNLTYSINNPPIIASPVPNQIYPEDNGPWSIDLSFYESDLEDSGSDLRWYITGANTSLYLLEGEYSSDDVLTFTPYPDAFGNNQVILWIEDSFGATTNQTLWINITSVNDAPEIQGVIPSFDKHENDPNWQLDLSGYKYDRDDPDSGLSWSALGWNTNLFDSVSMAGDILSFDLAPDAYGNDEMTIILTDGSLLATQNIWINVTVVNKPPVINGTLPSFSKTEDDPLWVLDLTLNETDREDGNPSTNLVWTVLGIDTSLLSVSTSDNNVTFTLVPNAYGSNELTIMLEDSQGLTDTQNIWVNVTSVNDPPIISVIIPNFEKNEDASDWNYDLSGFKTDADNSSAELSWQITGWNSTLFDSVSLLGNTLTFDLAQDAYGSDDITIILSDGLLSDSQTFWVNVTGVNDAPQIMETIPGFNRLEDAPSWALNLTSYESDIEDPYPSPSLSWSVIGVDLNLLTITIVDNNLTFELKQDASGSCELTIILIDSGGLADSQKIWVNVTPQNDAPLIVGVPPSFDKDEDAVNWNCNLSIYKSDVDNALSELSWGILGWDSSLFDLVSVIGDEIAFDLALNAWGNDEITLILSDGLLSDTQTIWVNVSSINDAPVILGSIPDFTQNEDDLPWTLYLTTFESDIEDSYPSSSLVWSVMGVNSLLLNVLVEDNNITFTLVPHAFGNNLITMVLTDSGGETDSQNIWINVSSFNDPPIILGMIPSFERNEDSNNWQLDLSGYKQDVDNSSGELSWQIVGWDIALFDSVILVGDILTFDLAPHAYGSNEITIILSDGISTDTQAFWVNITSVNDMPQITGVLPNFNKLEDDLSWVLDLTTFKDDVEDSNPPSLLSWNVLNVDLSLLSVSVLDNNLTFTLIPDAYGNDEVMIVLTDTDGGTVTQKIWINVTSVNDAPRIIGTIPSFNKDEDAGLWNLDLSPYMFDIDNLPSELSWSINGWDTQLFNSVNLAGNVLNFDLTQDGFGDNEITIILDDGSSSDSQNIWINVTSINDEPIIIGTIPDIQMVEDSSGWVLDLTSYESDVEDGSPSSLLTWSIYGVDTSLIIVSNLDNNITFNALPEAFGLNYITITLTDSDGATCSQIILIDITPVNDEPTISDTIQNIVLDEDTTKSINLMGNGSDVEDTPQQLRWSLSGTNNTLYSWQIDPVTNELQIIPHPNAYGTNDVTLILMDTQGATAEKSLQIAVLSRNDKPYIQPAIPESLFETLEDEPISVILTGYENDIEDSNTQLIWDVTGVDTSIIRVTSDLVNDQITIVPIVIFSSQDTDVVETEITLILTDTGGETTWQNITVKIIPVNNAPVISDLPDITVKFNEAYVFDFTNYVSDEDTQKDLLIITTSESTVDLGAGYINVSGLSLTFWYPHSEVDDTFSVLVMASDGRLYDYAIMQVSVSDHSPPEFLGPLPNIYFDEDSGITEALDLGDYFIRGDDGALNYTYYLDFSYHGDEFVFVTINKNNTVDFSSAQDWYGIEHITFRAQDNFGAIAEGTLMVTVNPINDAPTISGLLNQECKVNVSKVLDLEPYINDVDTPSESLMIACDSPNIITQGHTLIFVYFEVSLEFVNIVVLDGFSQDDITIQVTASSNNRPSIVTIPDLMVGGGEVYLFSILPYISDMDNEIGELQIWTDSGYITPNAYDNMLLQLDFPMEMVGQEVTVTVYVSDGLDINSSQMHILITDEMVPTLTSNLPNLLFEEDSVFSNAINLDDYFLNASSYQYFGNEKVNIIIQDNWVSLTAFENWSGTEMVTFRGAYGNAFVEDTIEIVVKPVDDPPTLLPLPSYDKKVNEIWNLNLLDYIQDIDTPITEMTVSVDSPYVIQYAMNIYFQYQSPIYDRITITVSDGRNLISGLVNVTVTADNHPPTDVGLLKTTHLKTGETWSIDLDDYFYDIDEDDLTFYCNHPEITINPITHIATWTPSNEDSTLDEVIFTADDGYETIESSPIDLVVSKEKSTSSFFEQFWWIFLLIAILCSVLIAFFFTRRGEEEEEIEYEIDENKAISYLATKGGGNYIIKSDTSDSAYKVFSGLLQVGFEGLCITTKQPEDLTDKYDLGKAWLIRLTLRGQKNADGEEETQMMGLLALGDEDRVDDKYMFSSNFNTIVETIEEFLMGGDRKVVLLDGLEYILGGEELIMYIGFIASVRERLKDRNSALLIPIDPKTLSEKELRLLERETEHLGEILEKQPKEVKVDLENLASSPTESKPELAEIEDES